MMVGEAIYIIYILFLMIALFIPLVLYSLVQAEHDQREEMNREDAECAARRDIHEKP